MAKTVQLTNNDDLVLRARTDTEALGRLYDLYYKRIFRFCICRLFYKETAEDVTSTIFLQVARKMSTFTGRTEADFRNWLYAIAVNHTNAYIRKTLRRKRLFAEAARAETINNADNTTDSDWPTLYKAILKLRPRHQTIVTLRFFENLNFEQIAKIINAREATVRVTLHRILKKLRDNLQPLIVRGRENEQ